MSSIEVHEDGTIVCAGREAVAIYDILAIRTMLKLQINVPSMRGRRTALWSAHNRGLTVKRTFHGAWQDVDLIIRMAGGPEGPQPTHKGKLVKRLPFPRGFKLPVKP